MLLSSSFIDALDGGAESRKCADRSRSLFRLGPVSLGTSSATTSAPPRDLAGGKVRRRAGGHDRLAERLVRIAHAVLVRDGGDPRLRARVGPDSPGEPPVESCARHLGSSAARTCVRSARISGSQAPCDPAGRLLLGTSIRSMTCDGVSPPMSCIVHGVRRALRATGESGRSRHPWSHRDVTPSDAANARILPALLG